MFELSKENITEYLKKWMPSMDFSKPLKIYVVGEGALEDDGDGFINIVYRVSDGKTKIVVKQGLPHGKMVNGVLPVERNQLEYESLLLRKAIAPEYVPDVYFFDAKNYIFAMEDVAYLKIARFQLNKSIQFPKLAFQIAEYSALTSFYSSEYYLKIEEYRKLVAHFMNQGMRTIFEDGAFTMSNVRAGAVSYDLDPLCEDFGKILSEDPAVVRERLLLRDSYMKDCETFIHGDLHTSNMFVDQDSLKVIDMEYTFAGPMSYDIGYAMNCFLAQYISADFRTCDSVEKQKDFQNYCLASFKICFEEFFRVLTECWKRDAKPEYRDVDVFREAKYEKWSRDIIGYCANANFGRAVGNIGFPEYDVIEDPVKRRSAVCLSALIDRALFIHRYDYKTIDDCIADIRKVRNEYFSLQPKA